MKKIEIFKEKINKPLKIYRKIKQVKKMNKTIQYLQMVIEAGKKTQLREPWRWKT